jgi:hypothetical protein
MILDGRWRKALSTAFTKENTHEKNEKKYIRKQKNTYEKQKKYMSKTKKYIRNKTKTYEKQKE